MSQIVNIAAYQFATLSDLKSWRGELIAQAQRDELKGTVLLSTEGINLFIAGGEAAIESFLATIRQRPSLESLKAKYSLSEHQPFRRLLVRIKKEIIAFGVDGISPGERTSPKLAPAELKQWLDEGRQVTLLDTRNDYEVKLGTFAGAKILPIDHFREFPAAVAELPEKMKTETIVMFCTGGIRCEKAGPYMEKVGFKNIYQLDGGILKYFEDVGSAHYDGECFVFDQRVGVDPALSETSAAVCYKCLAPLTEEDQADPRYVVNQSCPECYREPAECMTALLVKREAQFRRATTPLPGLEPYDNIRPLKMPLRVDGRTLTEALAVIFPYIEAKRWDEVIAAGHLRTEQGQTLSATDKMQVGQWIRQTIPATTEPPVSNDIGVLYEDEAIIVLNKPAPLPMHPCGRYHRHSLMWFLHTVYAPQKPRPAHRLDANTTGVIVCSRTRHFASRLQPQFSDGVVKKVYLARILGHPTDDHWIAEGAITTSAGRAGSRKIIEEEDADETEGRASSTEFRVLSRESDGTSLIECHPRTGRTHQIRLHLWHAGWPIQGDPTYLPDRQVRDRQTLSMDDPPLCLHAWQLTFFHPANQEPMSFSAPRPEWAQSASVVS